MKYHVLASGSKGNCFVLQSNEATIVVDCGSTKKHLTQSFHTIGVNYTQVDGLLITHLHTDHISQLRMFADVPKYSPVQFLNGYHFELVQPLESFKIKDITITPIPLSHDSEQTVGYIFVSAHEKLVYMTDTGYVNDSLLPLLHNATYIVIESNHDPVLLMNSRRPFSTKSRILSDSGHLSNEACALVLKKVVGPAIKEIVLAHISEEANTHALAFSTVKEALEDIVEVEIKVAKQFDMIIGGTQ